MKRKGNLSAGIIKGISKAEKEWKGISNTTGSLNSQCFFSREHRERVKEILAAQERRK